MTYRVELTDRARRDLRRLYRAIDAGGSEVASGWFNGLEAAVLSLRLYPERCPTTPEREDLRHLLYGSTDVYRVIFRIDPHERRVIVVHVRHGARRPLPKEHDIDS